MFVSSESVEKSKCSFILSSGKQLVMDLKRIELYSCAFFILGFLQSASTY